MRKCNKGHPKVRKRYYLPSKPTRWANRSRPLALLPQFRSLPPVKLDAVPHLSKSSRNSQKGRKRAVDHKHLLMPLEVLIYIVLLYLLKWRLELHRGHTLSDSHPSSSISFYLKSTISPATYLSTFPLNLLLFLYHTIVYPHLPTLPRLLSRWPIQTKAPIHTPTRIPTISNTQIQR